MYKWKYKSLASARKATFSVSPIAMITTLLMAVEVYYRLKSVEASKDFGDRHK